MMTSSSLFMLPNSLRQTCLMINMSKLLLLSLFFLSLASSCFGIRCYQCYTNSLEPCPWEDLRECPRYPFGSGLYNRCSVKVRKLVTGETFVKRECSLGCPDGSDAYSDRDLRLRDHCDINRPEYECKMCCRGDGCNWSASLAVTPNRILLLVSSASILLFFVSRCSSLNA